MSKEKHYNIDEVLTLDEKKNLLKEIQQEELLELFRDHQPKYTPVVPKQSPLDQKLAVGITEEEKEMLSKEVKELKAKKQIRSISALIRNRAMGEIDIEDWRERALYGLEELQKPKWDREGLRRDIRKIERAIDNISLDDEDAADDRFMYMQELRQLEEQLAEITRPNVRRGYRISGRVTLSEANHIRWRAARLNITVADYMRFLIFSHRPFTEADRHLSSESRQRFYISIIDVAENGWGEPPKIEECPNCARNKNEAMELRRKLERLQKTIR